MFFKSRVFDRSVNTPYDRIIPQVACLDQQNLSLDNICKVSYTGWSVAVVAWKK